MAHARTALTSSDRRVQATASEIIADVAIYSGDHATTVQATGELRELAAALDDPHLDAIGVVDHALAEAFSATHTSVSNSSHASTRAVAHPPTGDG